MDEFDKEVKVDLWEDDEIWTTVYGEAGNNTYFRISEYLITPLTTQLLPLRNNLFFRFRDDG
jgi:hypothetical protein